MQLTLPKVILGTSTLGNLYQALTQEQKTGLVQTFVSNSQAPYFFDSAGKYGAGLALQALGRALKELSIAPGEVVISNKLGWYQVPLTMPEPTFEKGVWKDIQFDAVQRMGYDGILACYEQGNHLLEGYAARFVSVHDPDEYLQAADGKADEEKRYAEILASYEALFDLKNAGKVEAIGVGAKDWQTIQRLSEDIRFDWVMIANSMTVHSHPPALASFIQELAQRGTHVINSAVFNGGFLTGGDFYNYQKVTEETARGKALLAWRRQFFDLCKEYGVAPAAVAIDFGRKVPGVGSICISSSHPARLAETIATADASLPGPFWDEMKKRGLLK